ncbi:tRNA (adenine(22)-N(1))-methyltransferase [Vagococcus humatus]|uniref:tRNA (Adenine(22)-N(1))-methyltransferase TrmK n=1 Tax=Vagococcus humatus TaxID=1889241 RepID=A0A3R9YER7_9ENTE|nr:tRNA (adenine(22)-N(1))-methyltransferase TrmK [Vagococcus humatus]RST89569.1 tRNA (adenine(22)-N(1))-methyltransferase TrmK [Vagococcus humatus]
MNETNLSKRLATVAKYVPKNSRLADIGSDHAYLPAWLIQHDLIEAAVAGDVVKGPFQSADKLVRHLGLTNQIAVRLADGLEAIEEKDQIDVITIAGMGGALIRDILQRGKENQRLSGQERLILQPNIGEKILRQWLVENNYYILFEEILEEDHKIYEVIVAEKQLDPVIYTPKEIMFGPCLIKENSLVFQKKWQHELGQKKQILKQLQAANQPLEEKVQGFKQEVTWIKEVLNIDEGE